MPTREGLIPFRGYHTWFRIVGDREAPGKRPPPPGRGRPVTGGRLSAVNGRTSTCS